MYSQKAWGGPTEPHILIEFQKDETTDDTDPIVSLIVFEWKDYDLVGRLPTADSTQVQLFAQPAQCPTADFCTRKNTYATRRLSTMASAVATRPDSSSWQRMLVISGRTKYTHRQYI